jgi:hypothetical protein
MARICCRSSAPLRGWDALWLSGQANDDSVGHEFEQAGPKNQVEFRIRAADLEEPVEVRFRTRLLPQQMFSSAPPGWTGHSKNLRQGPVLLAKENCYRISVEDLGKNLAVVLNWTQMNNGRTICFRFVLPIAELIICGILLWPSAGFLCFQLRSTAYPRVRLNVERPPLGIGL